MNFFKKMTVVECCIIIAILIILVTSISGCTGNSRARKFGGETTQNLPKGKKLINATWKESNLWVLTRNMEEGDKPVVYEFVESSNYGLLEGKIIFIESK